MSRPTTSTGPVDRPDPPVAATNGTRPARLRRLAEELDEVDHKILAVAKHADALVEELDYAMRPPVHERRAPSYGAIIDPTTDLGEWQQATGLEVSRRRVEDVRDSTVRRFADGIVSWVVRRGSGIDDLVVFDHSVGSERDLTVLANATGGDVVRRHPAGWIRAVGRFGVLRRADIDWQLELPIERWLDPDRCRVGSLDDGLLTRFVQFAVHDVGARGIGAMFVISPKGRLRDSAEVRYGRPPEFNIGRTSDLAPLYHILGQLDGAAVFDETGTLRQLGVRLVPSVEAEALVDAYRGTRHTSALRYSYDDPDAMIVVVSEDGPVSVIQGGRRLGQSG